MENMIKGFICEVNSRLNTIYRRYSVIFEVSKKAYPVVDKDDKDFKPVILEKGETVGHWLCPTCSKLGTKGEQLSCCGGLPMFVEVKQ